MDSTFGASMKSMGSTGGAKGPGLKRSVDRLEAVSDMCQCLLQTTVSASSSSQTIHQQAEVVARHEKEILQVRNLSLCELFVFVFGGSVQKPQSLPSVIVFEHLVASWLYR